MPDFSLKPIVMSETEAQWVKKGLVFLVTEGEAKRLMMDAAQIEALKAVTERL